ncbi:MAG TPA: site-2 protease family protein [Gemmatimonadaceae bacterium]|jgi:Zn-dependent protease
MRWSWRLGRVAGIDLYVHATFVLLLAWVAFQEYAQGPAAIAASMIYIIALFAIVVLHELGHALTARRYGIRTRDITLLPIGGVARLERMPRDPRQELLVALAGPAVNVVLAIVLYGIVRLGGQPPVGELYDIDIVTSARAFLYQLAFVNVVLAAFNLLPAFPMDGGRVLRAILAMRLSSYTRATEIAARVGRVFALLLGIAGLYRFTNPFWVLIALFVWLGAGSEAAAVQTSATLDGVPIEDLMIREVHTLAPDDPLSRAVQFTLEGFQQDFPVVDASGGLVGVLTRADLLRALSDGGASATVADSMHRRFATATPEDRAEEAIDRLRNCGCNAMPVVRGRELLGVLTLENIGEYIMIRSAMAAKQRS